MSTYVIAELGACHDGTLEAMLQGVHVARACGANACKLQWTSDPDRMAERRGKAAEHGYGEIYRRYLAWPAEWHELLRKECDRVGIDYMCSVYLPEDVEVVAPFVRHFKIASFEARDVELIRAHDPVIGRRTLYISLGMGAEPVITAGTMDAAMFLRCVSAYPAPHEALDLRSVRSGDYDGLSDHTAPGLTWTGALAVAAGAEIIEAHYRLDNTDPENPDYPHAMSPDQFKEYVGNIRFTEQCMGDGDAGLHESEIPMAQYKVT